ncbi:glycosyl hydrolase [Clostridium sp. MCC353]|uniref:glycoside hydrolase family 3 C-terminal domain-containing protein n=1 Tax=Clostridium sp. MCC353 TaxID=2592646 RepID=UPI001C029DB8|nr:glycoside hydrolase family 3 C-terminal domain-containing protein [Clostridium sp. MCC353]MBT9777673.1 glycosyl hydrolase [Clostridium sp. MCC353]
MNVKELVAKMTLKEKAAMCSGADFWHTEAVPRLGIPASMVSDGPHGLRKQADKADHLGLNESIKAVCFPAGCATAASFDRELVTRLGEVIGNECQAEGVSVVLGPALNIKRSPLCGRNFEYYSEDPYLSSQMAGAFIKGVQSKHVGTSPKHFLANNQEHRRMSSSSEVDERTLREIYLAAFEDAVKEQKPWTMMCSYNKINGVYAAENKEYLTHVLRDEWGFDGYVMSDWGAVNDRVPDLEAGLDLEMPSSHGTNDRLIEEAVLNGSLNEAVVDQACERILNIVYRFEENRDRNASFDRDIDHEAARKIAEECVVLLKNQQILPLNSEKKIACIGIYAKEPRYQGGGSSHINSSKITSSWEVLSNSLPHVTYAQGFHDETDQTDRKLLEEAVENAGKADVAVIFAGLPDSFESEGYDRSHMRLPDCQNELINAVLKVQDNVVVVLHNGSPVEMPWIGEVKAVVEAYLGGQAIGGAVADVLTGRVNPSGRLPETFPLKLEDNPSYLFYRGEGNRVEYREGVFVGYRYYNKKRMDALFPFGHGLSYTEFAYSDLKLDKISMKDTEELLVSVEVANIGAVPGKEVVQLYVAPPENGEVIRPMRELRGFEKIYLEPGEKKTVYFKLKKRDFSYWNTSVHDWQAESGEYGVQIGKSSQQIVLEESIFVESTRMIYEKVTFDTIFGDLIDQEPLKELLEPYLSKLKKQFGASGNDADSESSALTAQAGNAMIYYMPLRGLASFTGTKREDLEEFINKINLYLVDWRK